MSGWCRAIPCTASNNHLTSTNVFKNDFDLDQIIAIMWFNSFCLRLCLNSIIRFRLPKHLPEHGGRDAFGSDFSDHPWLNKSCYV